MSLTIQTARKSIARQIARWHTLQRALHKDHEEDRYRVIRAVVSRLPIADSTKQRILSWSLSRILDQQQRSLRSQMLRAQSEWDVKGHRRLDWLLASDEAVEIPASGAPRVSFVLVTYNKDHLTVLTLESVLRFADLPYELIVVDNGSTDSTLALLDRIKGAKIIRNQTNVGFGPGCMQAADIANGEYLCFLNNDALLTEGAITAALRNFDSANVGAVGGKILLANGKLQEAGSITWSDGSALGYGRGDDPELPQYNFRRPVDYCSAVFLITPKALFHRTGGFSEQFAPAYYEDTDYCMTLWQNGLSVIYEPLASIQHYESASSGGNDRATGMMAAHQIKFREKWATALDRHYAPNAANVIAARTSIYSPSLRILYIDDRIPKRSLGAGFPRSNDIVNELAGMGHHVVCSTLTFPMLSDGYEDLPHEVELFDGCRFRKQLLEEYVPWVDAVWVSRPHNLALLLKEGLPANRKFRLIYDAEAIFSQRNEARAGVTGDLSIPSNGLEPRGLEEELSLAKAVDAVVVVSEADRQVMLRAEIQPVYVVGHQISILPTESPFGDRDAFLFVGSMHGLDNPNADSIRQFWRTQWPAVYRATGAPLLVAGYGTEALRSEITDPSVKILGAQANLRPLYERARVFVVPTRYAAGLPFKAHEAAGYGVPMVVSPLIGRQMQWSHGTDYFVAGNLDELAEYCVRLFGNQQLWECFRANSLARVKAELSPATFVNTLRSVLSEACVANRGQGLNGGLSLDKLFR
jgi:GT2 family glycosyltransferase